MKKIFFVFILTAFCVFAHDRNSTDQLNIYIDERVELLTIIQLLADWPSFFPRLIVPSYKTHYLDRVHKYFKKYKNHPSVNTVKKFQKEGFTFDAPVNLIYHLAPAPPFNIVSPLTTYLSQRGGGEERLNDYVDALKRFYRDTKFSAFFKQNAKYYSALIEDVKSKVKSMDVYTRFFTSSYGESSKKYHIILSTIFPHNNYGFSVGDHYYNVTSPGFKYGDHPDPILKNRIPVYQPDGIEFILVHEFSHPEVNPLVDKYWGELKKKVCLFGPIKEEMTRIAYNNWSVTVKEHIVRAMTAIFYRNEYGEDRSKEELKNQKEKWHFKYINEIYDVLLQNLSHQKHLKAIFPLVIDRIKKIPCPKGN